MNELRVLLVDDQILFVESLKMVLEGICEDIKVVGIATSSAQAIELSSALQPEVVLLDIRMPETDGVATVRALTELFPDIRVAMLTTYKDQAFIEESIRNGAVGYILKDTSPAELANIVRAFAGGAFVFSPAIASTILEISHAARPVVEPLTRKERQVLELISMGLSNKEISSQLNLTEQTVKNYCHSAYQKLGVNKRTKAVRKYRHLMDADDYGQ